MKVTLSVKQVLETDGFVNSQVIAGSKGLDRKVTQITIAELPDTLNWLHGGELVCSTAYYLKDNLTAQREWISGMAQSNVAALAIKPGRFIGTVSQDILDLAEDLDFPLVELPLNVTWPVIISGVMNKMLDIQTKRLKQSRQIHDQLTRLVLESKGLSAITKTISELVKNPVILEDRFFNLIEHSCPHGNTQNEVMKIRLSQNMGEFIHKHPNYPEILNLKRPQILNGDPIKTSGGVYENLICPIIAGSDFLGWLSMLIINRNKQEESLNRIALEHGATVIALEMLKEKASLTALSRAKTDFLLLILEDTYVSEQDLQRRANLLAINLTLPTSVLIIEPQNKITYFGMKKLEDYVLQKDKDASIIKRTEDIVVLYHPKIDVPDQGITEVKNVAENISTLLECSGFPSIIGLGRCYEGSRQIKTSYYEAKDALVAAVRNQNKVLAFTELGLERLFSLFADYNELKNYCNDILGKLIEYDIRHKTDLVHTLKWFLTLNANQAKTSRHLHLHINSLNYRLQRIQEILAVDLEDSETRLLLLFALKVLKLNED